MPVEILLEPLNLSLSIISGIIIGFSLGLVGGGGSVLAVPLLLYVIGVKDVHLAIGTSALAIGIISLIHLISHRRNGHLKIKKGIKFTLPGIVGTIIGSQFGLWTRPEYLLILFAVFMISIGIFMIKKKNSQVETTSGKSGLILLKKNLLLSGFSVGILAGYFGIGGGFLIVPTLIYSGGLNIAQAVGTSLISVSSFGLVAAGRYFVSGNVDFIIAILIIIGGVLGGYIGIKVSRKIPKENLVKIFSVLLFSVATYIITKTILV